MAGLTLNNIKKIYPGDVTAVSNFTLEIKDKEFIVFVGPSGCGKSTTLRMVAGLEEITEGELYIGDRLVNDVAPKDRDIAMVFQNYALYPHMTVFDNMAFGLKLRKTPKPEIEQRVNEAAKILDIEHLLQRRPKALSGGQRQRVALGRAIVRYPQVFLLDEPLSNLDAKLRAQMRTELSKLHKSLGVTFIYVTHDQTEAMTMADRIVVMKDGFIQQVDSPVNLYNNPLNMFVAGFIGSPQINLIESKIKKIDGKYVVVFGEKEEFTAIIGESIVARAPELDKYIDKEVMMGIRPENLHDEQMYISAATTGVFEAEIEVTERMGSETYLYISLLGEMFTAKVSPRSTARQGDKIKIALDPQKIHLFDKDTEETILTIPAKDDQAEKK